MSYLHRAVNTTWFYLWFLFYVSRWDRFEAFRLRRLLRFELRSVVTVLILVSLGLQLAARLKYLEGFWTNPKTHEIQARPAQSWTEEDILHVEPLYYTLACSLSLQNCAFFLLQAFWSYISKSVTKSTFMSSFEFKVHLIASCGVVVLFPTVQYLFRNDFVYREVVPHLIFCILLFTTGVLGLRIHFRLVALVKNASITMNESTLSVLEKLEYFKDMNVILTFSLFACSFSLGIVAVDGITPHPTIAGNKFASDLLITNLNFFQVIIWVTLTLIFYPRKSVITASLGSHDNSTSNNNNNINNNNNNGGRHDITISNKRGHSDRFRLSRRNNEVQSEENLQNDSKAQLVVAAGAEDREILDPYWARDDSRQEQEYQQEYQHQQQQRRQHGHLRAFSHDSRNDTAITLAPLSPPPPSLTIVTSSAGQPDITKEVTSLTSPPPHGSPTSPTGRPEMETRTLYYHEALAKAQQQQQQEQSNEYYNMTSVATDSDYNTGSLPQRTFSQGSHYKPNSSNSNTSNSNNNNRNSGGASRPERSSERPAPSSHQAAALGRSTPTVDMHHHPHRAVSPIGRNTSTTRGGAVSPPPGGRSASSMDSRPPRDYPSITQAAAAAHAQDQDSPQELQRMRSAGSNYRSSNNANRPLNPATAHQEMGMRMMADPRIVDPRTVSALGHHHTPPAHPHPYQHRRQDSEESDLSVIQIAYVGNMNHASAAAAPEQGHRQGQHDEEFYNGLSSSALRPYSPR
ncbi:hypothetical protein KI688_010799 [Linnemannia hyalina]|uniref:Uncharacterized protein n=1 Tax=Linnemannia hyalina TaxID=64524 RepID=A0A9P7XWP6_9FUNG|nr:hypothetical protein KI688_010799 [Linnemannia hyalina]